jgi:hypothetical protein
VERFRTSKENLITSVKRQEGEPTALLEECDLVGWAQKILNPHAKVVAVCDLRVNL